jgi:hypothetical protein
MKRWMAAVALLLLAAPLRADFNAVVRAVESRYHVHQNGGPPSPLMGLVRFAVWIVHPEGVYDLQLAIYEKTSFGDAREIADIVKRNASEYRPMVQAWSNRTGECTLIFAKPAGGDRVSMLIFAHDKEDTTIVRVVVSPDKLSEAVHRPKHVVASLR